eukprot:5531934-Pyramimonas_sp.AAC.1
MSWLCKRPDSAYANNSDVTKPVLQYAIEPVLGCLYELKFVTDKRHHEVLKVALLFLPSMM